MIVPGRPKTGGFETQLPRHAEVNSEPALPREAEKHLLATRLRGKKSRAGEGGLELADSSEPKHSLPGMKHDRDNSMVDPRIPLLAIIFHFGQLRHAKG
jgi:hypothetical protein